MALLAEEIVEEWLNRDGWFTIRGARIGLREADILAVRQDKDRLRYRHIEVHASLRPVSYMTDLPKAAAKEQRRHRHSAKERSPELLHDCVRDWIAKKYDKTEKLMRGIHDGKWERELVVNVMRHPEELPIIEKHGIVIHRLAEIIRDLQAGETPIERAAGGDFVDLVLLQQTLRKK
jgi:hypothetical protein